MSHEEVDAAVMERVDAVMPEMKREEETISASEATGLRARWNIGRLMLTLVPEGKKNLPDGVLDVLADKLGVIRQELGLRKKFAEKFSTDADFSTAVETHRNWTELRDTLWAKASGKNTTTTPSVDSIGSDGDQGDHTPIVPTIEHTTREEAQKAVEVIDRQTESREDIIRRGELEAMIEFYKDLAYEKLNAGDLVLLAELAELAPTAVKTAAKMMGVAA